MLNGQRGSAVIHGFRVDWQHGSQQDTTALTVLVVCLNKPMADRVIAGYSTSAFRFSASMANKPNWLTGLQTAAGSYYWYNGNPVGLSNDIYRYIYNVLSYIG